MSTCQPLTGLPTIASSLKLPTASEDDTLTKRATDEAQAQLQTVRAAGAAVQASESTITVTSKNLMMNPTVTLAISKVNGTISGGDVIDRIMALPFTALRVIDPQLARVGFGLQCDGRVCAAAMIVRRGLDKSTRLELYEASDADRYWNPNLRPIPPTPAKLTNPVDFPPMAASHQSWRLTKAIGLRHSVYVRAMRLRPVRRSYFRLERALRMTAPTFQRIPSLMTARKSRTALSRRTSLEGENGSHSSPIWQYLNGFGAVIIIPREPLEPSTTYSVSITADPTTIAGHSERPPSRSKSRA